VPGAADSALTKAVPYAAGFHTRKYRHVTPAIGRVGVAARPPGRRVRRTVEVDHLIPIELGGAGVYPTCEHSLSPRRACGID
jgi:hypothetical protein